MPTFMLTRDEITEAPDVGNADIPNLVQEAFEEGTADRRLTRIVAALGLLLASLDSSAEARAYAERLRRNGSLRVSDPLRQHLHNLKPDQGSLLK
jgi:hypothetical protein